MTGPKLNRDWIGLRVIFLKDQGNGYGKLPAGTEGTVRTYNNKGIEFESDKCECCGVKIFMTRLQRCDVEVLTPEEEWPDTRKGKN